MTGRPYASAAGAYLKAGWTGVLPLPPRSKSSPPEGYTGRNGREASADDVRRWRREHAAGNICLRLPRGVIGIDVDAYKDADHVAAWKELTERLGALPDAPWCSSRDDRISGIRLFRIPEDWEATGKLPEASNGVSPGEVIQWHHRYLVVPPSIHPGTGRAYRWWGGAIPSVSSLPALPQPWLDALSAAAAAAQPPVRPVAVPQPGGHAGDRPGDDYNERADWLEDVLGPHGWQRHHEAGGTLYVTRPGKSTREGHSATIGHSKDGVERLYVFSADAAPFELETPYSKFSAYALLNHGGDHRAAARELGRMGYGSQKPGRPAPLRDEVPWPSAPPAAGSDAASAPGKNGEGRVRRLVLTRASEIEPEPVIWAWEDQGAGRIPAGSLGLAAGREGTGKSSFAIWLTAQVTRGTLPGSLTRCGVIYVAVEDSWKFTIVPRLMAAGADLDQVYRAEVRTVEDETVSLSLPADNRELEDVIGQNAIAMVVLDPLMSAISDTLDTHVNRQVRQALDPLARMADRTGAVVLGIAHFNKSSGTDASSLITASGAFKDVARCIFAFATDPEDGTQVITQTKNSLGRSNLPSLAYRIISATVPTRKGDTDVGRFVLDGESERSVEDILGAQARDPEERDQKARAEDFLQKTLATGPRRSKEVEEEALQACGIAMRTLKRARADLRIPAARRDSGPAGRDGKRKQEWWISLPVHEGDLREPYKEPDAGQDANSAKPSGGQILGTLGTLGTLCSSADESKGAKGASPRVPSENALTSEECQGAKNATPLEAWPSDLPDSGEAGQPASPQERGGLNPRPDCQHTECHEALLGHCLTEDERATVRKFSDGGQPWKAAQWPEGSAGSAANPDGDRAA
jgi:AAA domain/Bifunctional DNA primase/polymerase, N-terminal